MAHIQVGSFVTRIENVMCQVDLLFLAHLAIHNFLQTNASSAIGWKGAHKLMIRLIKVDCTGLIYFM